MPKRSLEAIHRRKRDNIKTTKGETMLHKTLPIKLRIEQKHEPYKKTWVNPDAPEVTAPLVVLVVSLLYDTNIK